MIIPRLSLFLINECIYNSNIKIKHMINELRLQAEPKSRSGLRATWQKQNHGIMQCTKTVGHENFVVYNIFVVRSVLSQILYTHMPPLITLWTLKKRVTGTNYTTISIWKKAIFLWGKNLLYFGVFPTYKQLIKAEQWHFKSAWMKLGTSHMILAACLWHLTSLFIPLSVDIISIATTV